MFKREMKVNFKGFFIWTFILLGLFLVVFLIYPSIITDENIKMLDKMLEVFPEEMLAAFNMDISSIDSAYGWLKTEGFVFVLLITGCYSALLGSNILLKEENDKTIEYLNSTPVKRENIVISKMVAGVIYIALMIILLGMFNYICLSISGDFDKKQFLLLSITPFLSSFVIYFVCMFLSTFTHKTKKMFGISLGIVFISYILQTISTISSSSEFLKYFSIFTLADIRNVIQEVSFNPVMIFISLDLVILFFILTLINYRKKDLM